MELIYMYIKEFNKFIYDKEVVFSNNFNVSFKNGILSVEKVHSPISNIYGKNIKNITVLCGKNGTGKTTLLDIVGMNRSDRLKQSFNSDEEKVIDQYFLLYYLYKNELGEDIYGIEVCGDDVLGGLITNCKVKEDQGYNKSKIAIGIEFKYCNNEFIDTNYHFFSNHGDKHFTVSDQICIAKCNSQEKYSKRIDYNISARRKKDDDYLAKRAYIPIPDYSEKYNIIKSLQNDYEDIDLLNNNIRLEINDTLKERVNLINYDNYEPFLEKQINKLEDLLFEKRPLFHKVKTRNKEIIVNKKIKEKYILELISRYIIVSIIGLQGEIKQHIQYKMLRHKHSYNNIENLCENNSEEKLKIIFDIIDFLPKTSTNTTKYLGEPIDFKFEVELICKLIESIKIKEGSFEDKYSKLIKVSRYINSRSEACLEFEEENAYEEAFEAVLEVLLKIDEKYFSNTGIYTNFSKGITMRTEDNVIELLNLFKSYEDIEHERHNELKSYFNIEYLNLSEGEEFLINILGNVISALKELNKTELVVLLLDEPDCSLHPEWSRKFISLLIDWINKLNLNVQIIITTHSPYMVSDMFPQNVYRLVRAESNNLKIDRLSDLPENNSCFGANIYDLLNNSFFMDNPIGEFATNYIKEVINDIENLDKNSEVAVIEKIEFCIENIGDPLLKRALSKEYDKKRLQLEFNNDYQEVLQAISNEEEREKVRKLLEKNKGRLS